MNYIVDSITYQFSEFETHVLKLILESGGKKEDLLVTLYFKWKNDNTFYIINEVMEKNHNIKIMNKQEFSRLLSYFTEENPKVARVKNENYIY
jgi:hypothetical protein